MTTGKQNPKLVKNHPILVNVALALFSTLLTVVVIEIGVRLYVRIAYPQLYAEISTYLEKVRLDESGMIFQPHPYMAFTRSDTHYGDKGIHIFDKHFTFNKPKNTIRIACIGGSTTHNTHPRLMDEYLERDFNGQQYEVLDFGCASWTSQESLINYTLRVQDFQPDFVLIHHGVNDIRPRIYQDYFVDYSHFRTAWKDQTGFILRFFACYSFTVNSILYMKGTTPFDIQNYVSKQLPVTEVNVNPPDSTLHVFQRNIDSMVTLAQAGGASVILAPISYHPEWMSEMETNMLKQHSRFLLEYAEEHQLPVIDTRSLFQDKLEWFADKVHLRLPGIYTNSMLFSTIIRDQLRGYSEVLNEQGEIVPEPIRLYDQSWKPVRQIRLKWGLHIPNTNEYHVYFREAGSNESFFLAGTKNNDTHTLEWKEGNPLLNERFQNGPELGKDYWFHVYAIGGSHPYPSVGHKPEKGAFEVDDRILFVRNNTTSNK